MKFFWVLHVSKLGSGLCSVAYCLSGTKNGEKIEGWIVEHGKQWGVLLPDGSITAERSKINMMIKHSAHYPAMWRGAKLLMAERLPASPSDYELLQLYKLIGGSTSDSDWLQIETQWYDRELRADKERRDALHKTIAGQDTWGTEADVEVVEEKFVKHIARFGAHCSIARYGFGGDSHWFCIVDHNGVWAVIARGGAIMTREDPVPANQPVYIEKMWLEYDRFMKDIPPTPGEYRELQEFNDPLAVSEPEQSAEKTTVYPGPAVLSPVSARITEIRKAKGMSQQDLSAKTGITQAKLSRIESGSSEISCSDLFIIAEALQKPVAEFLETHRIGHDTLVWVMNTGSGVFEGYKTLGMSHYDDVYRTVFVAPVKYDRIMVINEDGSETSQQQEHLDYSNITAIPISGLRKAKGGNGYVLDMAERVTKVQKNMLDI